MSSFLSFQDHNSKIKQINENVKNKNNLAYTMKIYKGQLQWKGQYSEGERI